MEASDKEKMLWLEIQNISGDDVKNFTRAAVAVIPDYFFEIPASSTGKYHPEYALGEGGLLRHVKAAVRIALALFRNDTVTGKFSAYQKDLIISALILHDGVKSGIVKTKYTVDRHAVLMTEFLLHKMKEVYGDEHYLIMVDVLPLISSHMGQWNTDRDGNVHSPLPINAMQRFVHMCDYLASRKFIEINFNAEI